MKRKKQNGLPCSLVFTAPSVPCVFAFAITYPLPSSYLPGCLLLSSLHQQISPAFYIINHLLYLAQFDPEVTGGVFLQNISNLMLHRYKFLDVSSDILGFESWLRNFNTLSSFSSMPEFPHKCRGNAHRRPGLLPSMT